MTPSSSDRVLDGAGLVGTAKDLRQLATSGHGGAAMTVTCEPRCLHATGAKCTCTRCGGMAHGALPLPPSVQLGLFADERCSPGSSCSAGGAPASGASFHNAAGATEALPESGSVPLSRDAGATVAPSDADGTNSEATPASPEGVATPRASTTTAQESGVAAGETATLQPTGRRRCACGRLARWSSTRCETHDPWPSLAAVRGGLLRTKGRTA